MARKTWSVADVAAKAQLEHETVLVKLWSAGIDYVEGPTSRILPKDTRAAFSALGMDGARQRRVAYWLSEYGMDRSELAELLRDLGYTLAPQARSMPEGSIRRLNKYLSRNETQTSAILGQRREDIKLGALPLAIPFQWSAKGTFRDALLLSAEDVQRVHEELEQDFAVGDDPISPPGIRDMNLLKSAADRPSTSLGGQRKYATVQSAGAALLHSLVHNHPFHNGNKRTALVSMMVFLDLNNFVLESTEEEMFKWMLKVAAHELLPEGYTYDDKADREVFEICEWICRHSRVVSKEERAVTWRQLQKILRKLNCDITTHRGEKLKITREIEEQRRFPKLGKRKRVLETYFTNTGDGREVPRDKIKSIRHELFLDENHGVDSQSFYVTQQEPDIFITKYSKVLTKLAKV